MAPILESEEQDYLFIAIILRFTDLNWLYLLVWAT